MTAHSKDLKRLVVGRWEDPKSKISQPGSGSAFMYE